MLLQCILFACSCGFWYNNIMTKFILLAVVLVILLAGVIYSLGSYRRMLFTYKKYDAEFVYCNLTGLQFAGFAIDKLGLNTKICIAGKPLDERYIPSKDVVCLSNHIANTSSVSSICIVAHELGHAVQRKNQGLLYTVHTCLAMLSKLFCFLLPLLITASVVLLCISDLFDVGMVLLLACLAMFVLMFCLKLLTIPVEIQASKIAYNFLRDNNVLSLQELSGGKKVLDVAIGTYVASLFYPIIKFFKGLGAMFRR